MKEFFVRSRYDSNMIRNRYLEFRKQENMNIGAANLLNILIMSKKSKEMFENSC